MTDLVVKILNEERSGEGLFELQQDFTEQTVIGPITVPKGYVTDCASIPRPFRWLLPQCGHSAVASLLHDWLLHLGDPRATQVFSAELRKAGSGPIRRILMVGWVFLWTYPELHWAWMRNGS